MLTVKVPPFVLLLGLSALLVLSMSVMAERVHTETTGGWTLEPGAVILTDRMNFTASSNFTFTQPLYVYAGYVQVGSVRFEIETVPATPKPEFAVSYWNPTTTSDGATALQGTLTTVVGSTAYVNLSIPRPDPMLLGTSPFQSYDLLMDGAVITPFDVTHAGSVQAQLHWSGSHTLTIVSRNVSSSLMNTLLTVLGIVTFIAAVGAIIWVLSRRLDNDRGGPRE